MALSMSGNQLAVIAVNEAGDYEHRFTAPVTDSETPLYDLSVNAVMDYDGGRLAVCGSIRDETYRYDTCGFYLAVYGETGLLYCGEYASSLDAGAADANRCRPGDNEPLTVSWGK
jgi:hypothetical protein